MVVLMTKGERGDNPEVIGQPYANPEPIGMLEAGILVMKNAIYVFSDVHNIIPLITKNNKRIITCVDSHIMMF